MTHINNQLLYFWYSRGRWFTSLKGIENWNCIFTRGGKRLLHFVFPLQILFDVFHIILGKLYKFFRQLFLFHVEGNNLILYIKLEKLNDKMNRKKELEMNIKSNVKDVWTL